MEEFKDLLREKARSNSKFDALYIKAIEIREKHFPDVDDFGMKYSEK